jgi:hypothetical protein
MRRVLVVVLSAVAALATSVALAGAATSSGPALPTSDPFYTYTGTTPLAQVTPGTVLKARPVTIVISGVPRPFSASQVLYRTEGELGQPTVTVATVIKPLLSTGSTKLVSYQTFYDGLGAQCDPSYTLQGGNPSYSDAQLDGTLLEDYLLAGDTVVTADYEGEDLDWTAGYESGYDTLDGVRAAEHTLNLPSSTPVGMVGYSGGSIATEWASELAPSYAPELHIVGAAEGGIPVDFAHNLNYIDGSPAWSGIIPGVLDALTRAFGESLTPYLSPYGQQLVSQSSGACINSLYGAHPGLTVAKLVKPAYTNVLKIPAFVKIVNKLTMGTVPGHPEEPLLMAVGDADGTGDGVMIATDVEALAHEYCQRGVSVSLSIYKGLTHTVAAVPFEVAALAFLGERFAGVAPTDGCSSIGTGSSLAPLPVPCNFATGSIHGNVLAPVELGMTRKRVSRLGQRLSTGGHANEQLMCLQPNGLQLVYGDAALLRRLPKASRSTLRGRVTLISTANDLYALHGVAPGASLAAAKHALRLQRPFQIGANAWYFASDGHTLAVLKVQAGVVQELGIASQVLADSRGAELALLHSLS